MRHKGGKGFTFVEPNRLRAGSTSSDFELVSGPIESGRKQAGKVSLVGIKSPVKLQMWDPVGSDVGGSAVEQTRESLVRMELERDSLWRKIGIKAG